MHECLRANTSCYGCAGTPGGNGSSGESCQESEEDEDEEEALADAVGGLAVEHERRALQGPGEVLSVCAPSSGTLQVAATGGNDEVVYNNTSDLRAKTTSTQLEDNAGPSRKSHVPVDVS